MGILLTVVGCGDNWIETYNPDSEEPYGTALLPNILKARYPDAQYQKLPRNWTSDGMSPVDSTLYVAIGNGMPYTFTEAEALADFVEEGGEAFLATKEISNLFLSHIVSDSCLGQKDFLPRNYLDSLELVESAMGTSFLIPVISKHPGARGTGNYFEAAEYSCLLDAEHLLMIQHDTLDYAVYHDDVRAGQPIMTRFAYGEGHVTLLSYPMLLTNVFATDSLGRIAMEEVLGLLPADVSMIAFDYHRRSSEFEVTKDNLPKEDKGEKDQTNILKHVLARPPLATAWYLLLLGAIIFLVFGAKRRQRLIPLVQPRRNTTHEHLGNISRLYLSQPDNALMASKQFALFEAYCNRRFGLRPLNNDADYERFSKMAGVNVQYLETLKRYQSTVARNQTISNTGFVSIVRILQAIYKGIGRRFD
ncbi:MAG: hypothetical protein AB8F78_18745 [Saprospiraceae bacterium]